MRSWALVFVLHISITANEYFTLQIHKLIWFRTKRQCIASRRNPLKGNESNRVRVNCTLRCQSIWKTIQIANNRTRARVSTQLSCSLFHRNISMSFLFRLFAAQNLAFHSKSSQQMEFLCVSLRFERFPLKFLNHFQSTANREKYNFGSLIPKEPVISR